MHISMPYFWGRGLFVVSATHCIVGLFQVRIRADLLLRSASFRKFMFSSYSVQLFVMMCLLSVVDSLIAHTMRNLRNNNDILVDCNVVNYGPGNVVVIATGYRLDGPGSNPGGGEVLRTCPDRPWGPPSLLYNRYRCFPGGKERPGRDADPSPPSSAVVKKG